MVYDRAGLDADGNQARVHPDPYSEARYARLQALTATPPRTVAGMQDILRDHTEPGAICQHGAGDFHAFYRDCRVTPDLARAPAPRLRSVALFSNPSNEAAAPMILVSGAVAYNDVYGNYVVRGWLIYDFRQDRPQQFGSTVFKTSRFKDWFSNVVVASDSKGQYHYALTIGDQIRTTLTPMTFSKPGHNGVQWDFAADKYQGTVLLARPSRPAISSARLRPGVP